MHVWTVISLAYNSAQLISRDKLEVQCRYCFQTETQTGPAGPLTFKAGEAESGEDAGSLLCLCLLLLFDCWAKLFNQVWNHKKAAVLHCPRTESLLTEGCAFFCYPGTGGSAQLCKSPVAWLPAASLPCRRTQCLGVSRAACSANPRTGMARAAGPAEAQTFCLPATSGISVVYVGNLGGQWQSQCGYCI